MKRIRSGLLESTGSSALRSLSQNGVTNTICVDAFDAAAGGPDLGTTKWTANGDTLHLWLELCAKDGPMLNLQAMDYRLLLVMDTDGQPQSGSNCHGLPGSEAMLSMPGPDRRDPNKPGMGAHGDGGGARSGHKDFAKIKNALFIFAAIFGNRKNFIKP